MFVTSELKEKIRSLLVYLDARSRWLHEAAVLPVGWAAEDPTRCYAAERAVMVAVDAVTDIASDIIDAFVMRDAGGYADLVRVLVEEGVLTKTWFEHFVPAVEARQMLLRHYRETDAAWVETTVAQIAPLLPEFGVRIRGYLSL